MKRLNYSQQIKLNKTLTVIGVVLVALLLIGLIAGLVNKPADDDREKVDFKIYNGNIEPGSMTPSIMDGYLCTSYIPVDDGDTFTIVHDKIQYVEVHYYFEDSSYNVDGPMLADKNEDGEFEFTADIQDSVESVRFVFYMVMEDPDVNIFERWQYQNDIKIYKTPGESTVTDTENE